MKTGWYICIAFCACSVSIVNGLILILFNYLFMNGSIQIFIGVMGWIALIKIDSRMQKMVDEKK